MLKKAIQSLRPTLRSMQGTAEAIGISLAAAKGRLFHAKNVLRRSIIPKLVHQTRFASGIRVLPAGGKGSLTDSIRDKGHHVAAMWWRRT